MEPDLIADVLALALALTDQAQLTAVTRPVRAAWLADGIDAVPSARASGTNGDGVSTIDE